MPKKRAHDPLPDEFASCEEAAEFWGTHDTTEYLDAFKTVDTMVDLRRRYYEVEIEQDVAKVLRNRARKGGTTPSRLASKLLREQLL